MEAARFQGSLVMPFPQNPGSQSARRHDERQTSIPYFPRFTRTDAPDVATALGRRLKPSRTEGGAPRKGKTADSGVIGVAPLPPIRQELVFTSVEPARPFRVNLRVGAQDRVKEVSMDIQRVITSQFHELELDTRFADTPDGGNGLGGLGALGEGTLDRNTDAMAWARGFKVVLAPICTGTGRRWRKKAKSDSGHS